MIQEVEFIIDTPAITMELIEYGNLSNFLKFKKEPIGTYASFLIFESTDWYLRMKWSMELSNALLFLHINGIIHSKFEKELSLIYIDTDKLRRSTML